MAILLDVGLSMHDLEPPAAARTGLAAAGVAWGVLLQAILAVLPAAGGAAVAAFLLDGLASRGLKSTHTACLCLAMTVSSP